MTTGWKHPGWGFQSKADALTDLLGASTLWAAGGGGDDALPYGAGIGNIYYVDGTNGADTSDGLTQDTAFKTITRAVSACTANNHDVIYILSYPAAGATGETWPIDISKATTAVVGAMRGGRPAAWISASRGAQGTNAINVTANYVTLKSLEIGGDNTYYSVQITAGVTGTRIEGCWIGASSICNDTDLGIGLSAAGDAPHTLIINNVFGPYITDTAIKLDGQKNMTRGWIIGNVFRKCQNYGIYITCDGHDIGGIVGNYFQLYADDTAGGAIYMSATAPNNCLVAHNRAAFGTDKLRYAPFYFQAQGSMTIADNEDVHYDTEMKHPDQLLFPGHGRVIYVDGTNGDNDNTGTTPHDPLLTITEAITRAADGEKDVIVILSYPTTGATGETWPISVTAKRVTIVGGNSMGSALADAYICPTGDTAAFSIADSHVTLKNLQIGGGSSYGCIVFSAGGMWGLTVDNCQFGVIAGNTPKYGIYSSAGQDCPHIQITNCHFKGSFGGCGITDDFIQLHNATRGFIGKPGKGNTFQGVLTTKHGINITASGNALAGIIDNRFGVIDEAGAAITLAAGGSGNMCIVSGNMAGTEAAAVDNNVFQDDGADDSTAAAWSGTQTFSPGTAVTVT